MDEVDDFCQHQTGEGEETESRQRLGPAFIVTREAAKTRGPREAALDHPASGQQHESAFGLGMLGHFQFNAVVLRCQLSRFAGITLIHVCNRAAEPPPSVNAPEPLFRQFGIVSQATCRKREIRMKGVERRTNDAGRCRARRDGHPKPGAGCRVSDMESVTVRRARDRATGRGMARYRAARRFRAERGHRRRDRTPPGAFCSASAESARSAHPPDEPLSTKYSLREPKHGAHAFFGAL